MFMTFMIGLNVVTVFDLLSFFGHGISGFSKPLWITGVVSLAVILYFLLVYNGKSASILSRYEGESKRARLKGPARVMPNFSAYFFQFATLLWIVASIALASFWLILNCSATNKARAKLIRPSIRRHNSAISSVGLAPPR